MVSSGGALRGTSVNCVGRRPSRRREAELSCEALEGEDRAGGGAGALERGVQVPVGAGLGFGVKALGARRRRADVVWRAVRGSGELSAAWSELGATAASVGWKREDVGGSGGA